MQRSGVGGWNGRQVCSWRSEAGKGLKEEGRHDVRDGGVNSARGRRAERQLRDHVM